MQPHFNSADDEPQEIPYGYCKCGCGRKTTISSHDVPAQGYIKGTPRDYISGHHLQRSAASLSEAFWQYCPGGDDEQCWEWQGTLKSSGYGTFRYKYKQYAAHRVSYELHKGEIVDGLCVCHTCDNRRCVNPAHLWLGTHADNVRDMVQKGRTRQTRGQDNHLAKLTEADVISIRELAKQGIVRRVIAKQFGVSTAHIHRIVWRRMWAHVP